MRKLLFPFLFLLSTRVWAACPLARYPENHKLDADIQNICQQLQYIPLASFDVTGTSATVLTSQGPNKPPVWQAIPTSSNSLTSYRRPNIIWLSTNAVTIETGLDGTSGDGVLMFPDGTTRTENSPAFLIVYASNTASSSQGGIRVSTAITNDWYKFYGVKVGTSNWEVVADTNDCVSSNFSFLNSVFGTNAWVCLNLERFGDGSSNASGTGSGFLKEKCAGEVCRFSNSMSGTGILLNSPGVLAGTGGSASTFGVSYTAGMTGTNLPPSISHVWFFGTSNNTTAGTTRWECDSSALGNTRLSTISTASVTQGQEIFCPVSNGFGIGESAGSGGHSIAITGFIDSSLGVGSNPLF